MKKQEYLVFLKLPRGLLDHEYDARRDAPDEHPRPRVVNEDYQGEALDLKALLLKAVNAINRAATDVCHYFDPNVKKVSSYLGWEQEYFLVDEGFYVTCPDLLMTGRTLLGHESAKNQQLEDHYFGSIPTRVTVYMKDLEFEACKYGIPLKTCHNEVAPNQFELAPMN